jgi:SRSO17 transposase
MRIQVEFDRYLKYLCEGLGHVDRHDGLIHYCQALMLPLQRKSVEPLAASVEPTRVSARHQSLHHFVAQSNWSDEAIIDRAAAWVVNKMKDTASVYWIVDDTSTPKKGKHSVGVAHQYCGQLGKEANCQVAVSVSLATAQASIPVSWQLYLPKSWRQDRARCEKAGVPEGVGFQTKQEIALGQIGAACARELPRGVVLADAGYGNDHVFREGVDALGLKYMVGVHSTTGVWAPGQGPLPVKTHSGRGRRPKRVRYGPGHQPMSVKALALSLEAKAYRSVSWREGTNKALSSRFAALRVRVAHGDYKRRDVRDVRPEQWLLIEWPSDEAEPTKYWLSTLPPTSTRKALVEAAKMRWRVERDYQELKQELGLNHYEGRGWRGFHHHATLCIAAYGFLVGRRLTYPHSKKNCVSRQTPALPEDYIPRGSPARAEAYR